VKIAESAIQFYSERSFVEEHIKKESLTTWKADEQERTTVNASGSSSHEVDIDKHMSLLSSATEVSLSDQAVQRRSVVAIDETFSEENALMMDLNIRILKDMIQRLTGKNIRIATTDALQSEQVPQESHTVKVSEESLPEAVEEVMQGGLIYESYESHYESEATSFSADGKIITEDGQEINFSVDLQMSREFFSEESLTIRAGDALKDPLVVNFSGSAAELTQTKFSFDIDNDGNDNQISFLKPGSGFLALDRNGDNIINNGSELFGPESGNGFQDLASYDSDGNNWIDENDSIYDKLRIWTKDADGKDILFGLGEKGVGAIYLGSASTLFSMKGQENELLGQVVSTGVFLGDNGKVGTIQQIDLVA